MDSFKGRGGSWGNAEHQPGGGKEKMPFTSRMSLDRTKQTNCLKKILAEFRTK